MAPALNLESESTLTERYQTTIPDTVRKALGLEKRDRIRYTIQPNGQVILSRVDRVEDDPALGQFLSFLARNIRENPQAIQVFSADLAHYVQSLVADVEFDLEASLPDEDE